jgi:hypothetical protein
MAKRRGRKAGTGLSGAAATIGAALGGFAAKIDNINRQKAAIAKEIQVLIKQAEGMMQALTVRETRTVKVPGATTAATPTGRGNRKKRSAAARKAMSEAQKRRWAAARAAGGEKAAKPARQPAK